MSNTFRVHITSEEPEFDDAHSVRGSRDDIEAMVDSTVCYYATDDPIECDGYRNFAVWEESGILVATGIVHASMSHIVDVKQIFEFNEEDLNGLDWEDWDGDEIATYFTRPHAHCCPWGEQRIYLQKAEDRTGVTWYRWRDERTDETGPPSKDREAVTRDAKAEAFLKDECPKKETQTANEIRVERGLEPIAEPTISIKLKSDEPISMLDAIDYTQNMANGLFCERYAVETIFVAVKKNISVIFSGERSLEVMDGIIKASKPTEQRKYLVLSYAKIDEALSFILEE